MVGTSGRTAVRLSVVTASARTWPLPEKPDDPGCCGGEHHLVGAGDDVLQRRRRALVGDVHDIGVGFESLKSSPARCSDVP